MIPIYSLKEAKETILVRKSILETDIPPHVQQRIVEMFNEPLSPQEVVKRIIQDIATRGDDAAIEWTKKLDKASVDRSLEVTSSELDRSLTEIDPIDCEALALARDRILAFHRKQPLNSWITENNQLGQLIRPIERVGLYIPGGTAPLPSTVLMSAIPAVVAGTSEILIVSPPNTEGKINLSILAACALIKQLNVKVRVFRIGGAQAIGALAYGTKTIPKVDKIVGPGNLFVSLAKREVFGVVGIEGIAGPTEAMILADETASHDLIAADLLAQAEHDLMAIPILVTTSEILAKKVQKAVEEQLATLTRKNIAQHAIQNQGGIIITSTITEALEVVNNFAPEHLSVVMEDAWALLSQIKHAGGVFVGEASCEVMGDYVAGPSHVMPTSGSARFASPLSVLDFVKIVSLIALDQQTVQKIAASAECIARAEKLTAHAEAARRRIK
ncbi:MAG: histidinol dehydrogenase [Candidatus Hermodarchaeota archaeon]